ncbi:hypothetical protein DL765_003580 [Monosporascus sp. GIB2]|nr:hypothetical protein DL765_003580 [Monosporascus sp. GIB2]
MGNIGSVTRSLLARVPWNSISGAEDLEMAVSKAQKEVDNTPPGHPDLAIRLDDLADKLLDRYNQTNDIGDLEKAISSAQRAVDITPPGHPHLATWLNNLANVLSNRYNRTGGTKDLEHAIRNVQLAVDITPPDDPDLAMRLSNLAAMLSDWFKETGDIRDLETAVKNAQQAVDKTPSDHPDLAIRLNNLANIVADRYHQTGDARDLENAIGNAHKAVGITPSGHPYLATWLSNLSTKLSDRYKRTGDTNDLEDAISNARRAVDMTAPDDPDLALWLSNLGAILNDRYNGTGDTEDLEEAVSNTQRAVDMTPAGHPHLAAQLHNLANMLSDRYSREGDTRDLEDAISSATRAVDMTPPDHFDLATRLNSLGAILSYRYDQTGDTEHLEYAISNTQRAIDIAFSNHHQHLARQFSNLANLLLDRHSRLNNATDLVNAINNAQRAVDITPEDHPNRAIWLGNLAIKLLNRYQRTKDIKTLDDAITNARIARDITPPEHPDLAMRLSNLAYMLTDRYNQNGDSADLKDALDNAQKAVDITPPDHPDVAIWLSHLANSLSMTGNSKDREAAIGHYSNACDSRSALPLHRIQAARRAIQLLVEQDDLPKASCVANKTVQLLPLVCSRYLSRKDQQHAILQTAGFAADACSLALSLELPDAQKALEHIEYGRGLIIGHLIDSRDDLSDVEEKSEDLAAACRALRAKVERAGRGRLAGDGTLRSGNVREKIWREREQAIKELEDCQKRIHALMGYEQFPPKLGLNEIKNAAKEGPVVIVNATDIRCDAIIVQTGGAITHVELPEMKGEAPLRFQQNLANHRVVDEYPQRNPREPDENDDLDSEDQAVEDYLSWLWSSCVELVLARLETKAVPPLSPDTGIQPSNLPRIWWIGTGAASSLPFHAATRYSSTVHSTENTLNRAISSYTPTLKTLIYSRSRVTRRKVAFEDLPVLLVAMPTSPDSSTLPAIEMEQTAIQEAMKDTRFDVRVHPTAEEVLGDIKNYTVVHFACHGKADRVDPSNSYLLLQKLDRTSGEISPSELTASMISDEISLEQRGAWIAYLSACSTAEVRAKHFADEGLHLAAAFQVAGFAHVIGTLQPASDNACAKVAGYFYSYLVANRGAPDINRLVAESLHYALSEAEEKGEIRRIDLVPYVHLGA